VVVDHEKGAAKTMNYDIQINATTYARPSYLSRSRWSTYARLVTETLRIRPNMILEIGPGNGLVTTILRAMGFSVQTLDFDQHVHPDIHMDVTDPRLSELAHGFDLVIAAEVLEHITYDDARMVLERLRAITPRLLITLPYTSERSRLLSWSIKIPGFRRFQFTKKIFFGRAVHAFNGQHYWEIGKRGFPLRKIRSDIRSAGWRIEQEFLNPENTYHYFFILQRA
jgi:hypothetical protein